MANFEALIRNALASQTDKSPQVREAVYRSSRNALNRIIEGNRSLTVEAAMAKKAELEECITRIEAEFSPPPPMPESPDRFFVPEDDPLYELQQILSDGRTPPPQSEPEPEPYQPQANTGVTGNDPHYESVEAASDEVHPEQAPGDLRPVEPDHHSLADNEVPALGEDDYPLDSRMPDGFRQRRRKQKIGIWIIVTLTILALLGWIAYQLFVAFQDGSLMGLDNSSSGNPNSISNDVNTAGYITVLKPSDLSSLVVAGRGTAELVTQQNTQMIRVRSLRDPANREQPAEPLLLRLKPGVLQQIRNKQVTVEIYAKSGTNMQAQFSVSCEFANGSDCGRKRFVAGIQPQASVFEFDFAGVSNLDADYFIAFNTDTTSNAAITGEGDLLDIVYVRLKTGGSG